MGLTIVIPSSSILRIAAVTNTPSAVKVESDITLGDHIFEPSSPFKPHVVGEQEVYSGEGKAEVHIITRKIEKHNKPKRKPKRPENVPESPRKISEIKINGERVPINSKKIKV
jgi:hypothetical protein